MKEWDERKDEIKDKMLEVVERDGPMKSQELWRAVLKEFDILDKIHTPEMIPEIILRRCVAELLDYRKLHLMPDLKLGLSKHYMAAQ